MNCALWAAVTRFMRVDVVVYMCVRRFYKSSAALDRGAAADDETKGKFVFELGKVYLYMVVERGVSFGVCVRVCACLCLYCVR